MNTEAAWPNYIETLNRFLSRHLARGSRVDFTNLTARERDVLALLARGMDNTSIAASLHISEKTVRNHVSSIFGKLGVSSRAEAVARARDASELQRR